MSRLIWLLAAPLSLIAAGGTHSAEAPAPHWIWRDGGEQHLQCRYEREFQVAGPARSAMLRIAAEFCEAQIEINGQPVLTMEAFSPTTDVDVVHVLRPGKNRIVVAAQAVGSAAAIAMRLSLVAASGERQEIVSDEKWLVASGSGQNRPVTSLGDVSAAMWGIGRRPATTDPFDNYDQWKQAGGDQAQDHAPKFWIVPGFEISLVRQARPDEGSWVSMAFDPRGRLTIAKEDQGLLRFTLAGEAKSVERVETINNELKECRGLLYADGSLFANANNSKGLYRLRDADRDDRFDEVKLLREFAGSVGHGRNDLAAGLYAIFGDSVDVPTKDVFDSTSPFREARRGQATREGFLLRTDKQGDKWRLLSAGLRNPFGIAASESLAGSRFSYDADAEFDMGTPWYRPTRLLELATGADYGWRGVTGKWPPYFPDHPDNGVPVLDIGRGSPTAVAFASEAAFPPEYRRALFILDWTYGRILAIHLAPHGAGFRAQAETFLQGRPLNVTDLAIGPDGGMYLITGGRKTQSALYCIRATSQPATEEAAPSPFERRQQQASAVERAKRERLEATILAEDASALDLAWKELSSADPVLRHAARIVVERQPVEFWRQKALEEAQPTAALTALMALARSGDEPSLPKIVARLLKFDAGELNITQLLMLLHTYSLCQQQAPPAIAPHREAILAQLDEVYPHPSGKWLHVGPVGMGNVQWQLARVLAELDSPTVVQKTCQSLLVSDKQEDRIMGLLVLRNVRTGWTAESRRSYFTVLGEGTSFVGGEGMPKFLAHLREDALAALPASEKEMLAGLLSESQPLDEPLPPARPVVKAWRIDDFLPRLADSSHQPDLARGATIFRDALCIRCHRVGARGPAVGPDLTNVASRFSRRDMLASILAPSQVVAENYRGVQLLTTDGRILVGRVIVAGDYRSTKLRLNTDPLRPTQVVEIDKREIEQVRETETSPMPQGLLDGFRAEEVLDLLAFLAAGAGPPAKIEER
ncbi:MAG: c-type cytochrome [Pirellulaceae bacterium]|nr:c-type cytochrome [Pirellulaceae bacterium]